MDIKKGLDSKKVNVVNGLRDRELRLGEEGDLMRDEQDVDRRVRMIQMEENGKR